MSLRSAGDDVVSRIARLLELEGDRWRPHRALELLSFVLGDRAQVGDASRYIFAYARHRGYDLPPYPLAGCGEIREFFADEGVRNVPDWYEKKLGLDERLRGAAVADRRRVARPCRPAQGVLPRRHPLSQRRRL